MLYAADLRWWRVYGAEVEQTFKGELWSCVQVDGVNHVEAVDDTGLSIRQGRIHTGGNTGYQLIGLAFMWGAARIILLGYDMQRGSRGESHHHGEHGSGLPNPQPENLKEWARRMIQLGADLRNQGVEVINASRETALKCFERQPIDVALSRRRLASERTAALLIPRKLLPREYDAFEAGIAAAGFERSDTEPDVSVIWGTYKGKPGGTVLVAENGYLDGAGGPYVALAVGGYNGAGWWPQGSKERFERLGVAVRRWRDKGGHILVAPSRGIGMNPMPKDWTERTVARLKQLTDREILVRPHPGQWKARAEEHDASLRRELEGAWACCIWASSAGVRALAMGIPTIYSAPSWICAEAAGTRLEEIESPPMPDRLPVFHRLASAQWGLSEIATGEPFRALLELEQELIAA